MHMFQNSLNIRIRFLKPSDIDVIKNLCQEWFPIKYPDMWYEEIASNNQRFYSLVAILDNKIVGLMVTEIKPYLDCSYEDFGFLCKSFENCSVAYILTLGVIYSLRRHGIATMLVQNLIINLKTNPLLKNCKAIYLHVLTTNTYAIRFYEKLKFQRYKLLPLYYLINFTSCDGYSYVYYINGGRPSLWWLTLFNPKTYYFTMKHVFQHFHHYTLTIFKCDHLKSLSLIISYRPYKLLRKFLQNIIFSFISKSWFNNQKTAKSHLYVC